MRPGQNRRMRGRNNRKGPNPLTRSYESSGAPGVKFRGTAQYIAEKYSQLARDAQSSGDPVSAENYLQHAEHYFRLIAAAQAQFPQTYGGPPRPYEEGGGEDSHEGDGEDSGGFQPQPQMAEGMPQPDMRQPQPADDGNYQPRQPQGDRQNFNRNNFRDQRPQEGRQDGRHDGRQEGRHDGRNDGPRRDRPRDDNRRDDNRRDDGRRDENRRDDGRRFQSQPGPAGDEVGLPSFLTTPVRQAQPADGNTQGGNGADAAPEGDGEGGHYSMRSRRRRGRGGRGFGGERGDADSDAPTSVE
jgi:hypothetical protein